MYHQTDAARLREGHQQMAVDFVAAVRNAYEVAERKDLADLLIRVKRVPFSNHFNYTVIDRRTQTVVMAGKVDSLAGTVYGLIADEIVHKMKVYRGDPLAKPQPPKS